jgi:voltage-gated potassium channel
MVTSYTKVKNRVFKIINVTEDGDKIGRFFDIFIITLIVVNVGIVLANTFDVYMPPVFHMIEIITVIIFTIEYVLRIWTADLMFPEKNAVLSRLKYIFSFMALVDFLSILPFYMHFLPSNLIVLRSLRVLRLLRLFKLTRYTNITASIGTVIKKKASQIVSSICVIIVLMVITSVMMYNVEHVAQPEKFANAFDSLWWTVATITTVGYGDIYPITILGQVFSGIIAFLSIGLIAIPTSIISSGFIEHVSELKEEKKEKEEKCFCPYCGKNLMNG